MKTAPKALPRYHARASKRLAEDRPAEKPARPMVGWIPSAISLLVATTLFLVPLVFAPGAKEAFRVPKQLLFEAGALMASVLIVFGFSLEQVRTPLSRIPRSIQITTAAVLAWMVVATAASTNLRLSLYPLIQWFLAIGWVASSVVMASRLRVRRIAPIVLIPAALNATLALIFVLTRWNPIRLPEELDLRASTIALLGNSNDVAAFLIPSMIFAVGFALTHRGLLGRVLASSAGALITAGIVISQSRSGFLAGGVGLLMITFVLGRKSLKALVFSILAAAAILLAFRPALFGRIHQAGDFLRSGNLDDFFSGRLIAYRTAFQMWLDHPITGVGPGTFRWHYLPYKIQAQQEGIFSSSSPWSAGMFVEVHSDFLQVLAETGLPGFLICLAALLSFAMLSLRKRQNLASASCARTRIAQILPLPLFGSLTVLMLFDFPLQLPATMMAYGFLAGCCIAWREKET